jgi:hypothetical protein
LVSKSSDFVLQDGISSDHVVVLFPLGFQLSHLMFQALDMFPSPLTDRSLGFPIIRTFPFQLFCRKGCDFPRASTRFSFLGLGGFRLGAHAAAVLAG